MTARATVLSVRALVSGIRRNIEGSFADVRVRGEIASITAASSGHWYFTLKDDAAQLRCVIFRTSARFLAFQPSEGMEVTAQGRVSVFEPRGDLQLQVEKLEAMGAGALAQAFEHLKRTLAAKGWFDADRKRQLPASPEVVGVVTSLSAAALFDALRILIARRPGLRVIISPTSVQGAQAPAEIASAIRAVTDVGVCDLVLVVRGGGSPEDLWAFNDPAVVEAVVQCPVPVVSGVGHEIDVTLCDLAADVRAATPTHAAQLAVPDAAEQREALRRSSARMAAALERRLRVEQQRIDRARIDIVRAHREWTRGIERRLATATVRLAAARPDRRIALRLKEVGAWRRRIPRAASGALTRERRRWDALTARLVAEPVRILKRLELRLAMRSEQLGALSPTAILARGYAIAFHPDTGRALRRAADVELGAEVAVRLSHGSLAAVVRSRQEEDEA